MISQENTWIHPVFFECLFLLETIPDSLKTQKMWENAVIEDWFATEFAPDCYKTQKICEKVVDDYP